MIGDVRQQLQAAPFDPFTIVTTSGRRSPVPSADDAGLNPTSSRVGVWFGDDASVTVAGVHVGAIEKGLPSGTGNGESAA
jgi:hypothetical protein